MNLNDFQMGDVILWKMKKGYIGKRIMEEQVKRGIDPELARYVHVDISGGGPHLVRVNPPTSKVVHIIDQYKGREYCVLRYKHFTNDEQKARIAFWAASHCNLDYDWLGILKFRFGRIVPNRKNQWFCSENALWAMQKVFPKALGIHPTWCMPAHFFNEEFKIVTEGVV